jgi:hypothetical protein
MYVHIHIHMQEKFYLTLKLCIWEALPVLFTLLFAQFRISASVNSFSWEWDLKFFKSWSILNLINCHRKAETDTNKLDHWNNTLSDRDSTKSKQPNLFYNIYQKTAWPKLFYQVCLGKGRDLNSMGSCEITR